MTCSSSSGLEEDEGFDSYRKGGYHAVRIGDQFAGGHYVAKTSMKCRSIRRPWGSLLIILGLLWSSIRDTSAEESSDFSALSPYVGDSEGLSQSDGRLSIPPKSSGTALIAALDGHIHLVDIDSRKIIWSFYSGSPIYSSYQAPIKHELNKENASGSSNRFFIDCGDDWELYMHSEDNKIKLSRTIDEVVRSAPFINEDDSVMIGSWKTKVFKIDVVTGKLIHSHALGSKNKLDSNDLIEPGLMNSTKPRFYITRTDYSLKSSFPGSEDVSWNLTVAEIEATLLCPDYENPTKNALLNVKHNSIVDSGFSMPLSCQSKVLVIRERNNVMSEMLGYKGLPPDAHTYDNMLLMPTSSPMHRLQSKVDKRLNIHPKNLMLRPASNITNLLQPNASSHLNNDSKVASSMHLMKINDSRIVEGHEMETHNINLPSRFFKGPVGLSFALFVTMMVGLITFGKSLTVKLKRFWVKEKSVITSNSKIVSSKRKKSRRTGKSNGDYEKKDVSISLENEDIQSKHDFNSWSYYNNLNDAVGNGRRIGKLFVSSTEIAKGSDGTIVLEGIYEGRPVAVKRLVKTHHEVAFEEVQNLIASDRHPNIVRWYGVEYDEDFVYLSLERCTCSLDDLIQIFSDSPMNSMFSRDPDTWPMIEYKLHLESVKDVMSDLNLWKENSRPSPLLLKLMRDLVSGLEHLHELGIIHRDLKPQNVLIVKQKSLCAKLSDMGISKRLLADMSSLGHRATGCGSSGWQAPEQLLHGRQTRAIDLFSLGCVLFFCITGGRHPFGDRYERDVNIVKNQMDLFLVEGFPEAIDLISQLLNPDPDLRPKASEVLQHPFFWSCETRLSFLRDTSDRVELEDRETCSSLLKALENTAPLALGAKWDEKMEPAFINNIGRYRRYKYDSVRDLLRVVRNKLNHYRELPKDIQELIGSLPEGFDGYFASRFPRLLIEVYKVVRLYCSEEEHFQKYFKRHD